MALGALREQHGSGTEGLADADGVDGRLYILHGVCDGEGLGSAGNVLSDFASAALEANSATVGIGRA